MSVWFAESESDLASLRRQLAEARENLRLIQERKSEFVMGTDIPLQLVKEERQLLERIEELEQRVERSEGTSEQAAWFATPTQTSRQLKVFLCHASGDKPAVRDLYRRLRSDGIAPWLDEEDLLPGQDWQLEIPKAVRSSDVVIICLSSRAITKAGYVQKEIKDALDVADRQPEGAIFLIPLRLEECDVPERLRRWQWVDVFQEKGYERLLRALRVRAEHLRLTAPRTSQEGRNLSRYPFEPEMVLIPAGEFLMGSVSRKTEGVLVPEQPQHSLYLPDYYIARTPVTSTQYAAFVHTTGHDLPKHWENGKPPVGKEDHPVVYISWQDAVAYCSWLSQVTGKAFRLPSEAEWEKAARGTDGRTYPWGDEPPDEGRCNFAMKVGATTPVGRYSPRGDSPYGCADLAGNVCEWTRSLYELYPYDPGDGRENLEADRSVSRMVRGGAFDQEAWFVRSATRLSAKPHSYSRHRGFRVVAAPVHL